MNFQRAIIFFVFLVLSPLSSAEELTKESVSNFMRQIDVAIKAKDMGYISSIVSDDARFQLTTNLFGKTETLKSGKQQYLSDLSLGWATSANYKYKRLKLNVAIEGDKAIATGEVKESMIFNGRYYSAITKERTIVEIRGGKLVITQFTGNQYKSR